MSKPTTKADYEKRMLRVIEYIHQHLDEPLDNEKLAEIACLSPYHWHRIYRNLTGETARQTIRRARLHRAANMLLGSNAPILEIAQKAGYGSVEAFTRAFASTHTLPPARYRQNKQQGFPQTFSLLPQHTQDIQMSKSHITIENLPPIHCIAIRHTGPYMEIGKIFEELAMWAISRNLIGKNTRSFALYHDDPTTTPPEKLRSDACIDIPEDFRLEETNDRFHLLEIAGGKHAVYLHKGAYAELESAYQHLYKWLSQSGETPANRPAFEQYLNNPKEVAPAELRTKICLPLI